MASWCRHLYKLGLCAAFSLSTFLTLSFSCLEATIHPPIHLLPKIVQKPASSRVMFIHFEIKSETFSIIFQARDGLLANFLHYISNRTECTSFSFSYQTWKTFERESALFVFVVIFCWLFANVMKISNVVKFDVKWRWTEMLANLFWVV